MIRKNPQGLTNRLWGSGSSGAFGACQPRDVRPFLARRDLGSSYRSWDRREHSSAQSDIYCLQTPAASFSTNEDMPCLWAPEGIVDAFTPFDSL
jgi:hypothetical protein